MLLTTAAPTVAAIWHGLKTSLSGPTSGLTQRARDDVPSILRNAAAEGSTGIVEAETVLLAAGIGVPTPSVHDTLALFGASPQTLYRRPGAKVQMLTGSERVTAIDLARLMMHVESLGFPLDPAPLCEALRPSLKAKAFLTHAEVAVYWHARERHRGDPMEVATGPRQAWGDPAETLSAAGGYRAELHRDAKGAAAVMKVTAPRWRPGRSGSGL